MKDYTNKKKSGCQWVFGIIIIIIILVAASSNRNADKHSQKASSSNNNIRNSAISSTPKSSSPASTKISVTNVKVFPTSTSAPTPVFIIYNSKDKNGAPFYSQPNNSPELLIRSLSNETQIDIIGEKEFHNNFDWFPIRDNQGRKGWIQAIYITDTNHIGIKPSNISNSTATKTPISIKTPVPTRKPTSTPFRTTWTCYDVTSIDYNWNNDNKCVSSSGEIRYVGDSVAMQLDPYYHPK